MASWLRGDIVLGQEVVGQAHVVAVRFEQLVEPKESLSFGYSVVGRERKRCR
jgi:hypothetical protein